VWLPPCISIPEEAIYYLGIDVHKRDSYIAVLDEDGDVVEEVCVDDSRTEGSISKHGSSDLRWILVQCANVAVNRCNDPYLGRFYARLKQRKNHQIAIVATARKLLVSIYHMLTRKEVYDPPGVSA